MKKTSTFQNGLIWFGAGVSLAEILTGTSFAPLGMAKGLAAILIGHIIGCAMMLLAGLIGGRTGRSAMETVKMSFGQKGGLLFAFLNVLQLVGWTAIMIYDGALAIGGILTVNHWGHFRRWPLGLVPGHRRIDPAVDRGGHHRPGLDQQDHHGRPVRADPGAVQGDLLLRKRHGRLRGGHDLRRGGGAGGGHALELAAPHQRLHPGGRKAGPGHLGQRGGVWPGVLLDVCHRHGRGDLYRGV